MQVEIPASADPQAILALIREELHSQGIAAVSSPLAVAPEHL